VLSQNYLDVYADFYKEDASEPFISLSPGRYTIVRAQGKDIGTYQFSLEHQRRLQISKAFFSAVTLTESRIKGSSGENLSSGNEKKENSEVFTPLSRLRLGGGIGFLVSLNNDAERNLHLDLTGSYYVRKSLEFIFDFYLNPLTLSAGFGAGIDYLHGLESGKLNFGGLLGCELHSDKKLYAGNAAEPFVGLRTGFTGDLNKRMQFEILIPYYAVFGEHLTHKIGVELELLIGGRFKDVAVYHE
jgi:hypothetical protein